MKASRAGPALFALAFLLACGKDEQPAAKGAAGIVDRDLIVTVIKVGNRRDVYYR